MALLAGPASLAFAQALGKAMDAPLGKVEQKRFPDGEAYCRVAEPLKDQDTVVVQATPTDAALVELILLLDAAREAGARTITAVVPYLGYARQDRAFQSGEAVSSRAILRSLRGGCDRLITVDPHKPEVLTHFGPAAQAVSAVPQLAAELGRWGVDCILAPDEGAHTRAVAAGAILGVPVDHLVKTRLSPTEVRMATKQLDVKGRRVAILDDLVASGGTMVTAAQELKRQGAAAVYAVCTHGLFSGDALPKLLAGGVDRALCTDTALWSPPRCDVVSAAPAVAAALLVPAASVAPS